MSASPASDTEDERTVSDAYSSSHVYAESVPVASLPAPSMSSSEPRLDTPTQLAPPTLPAPTLSPNPSSEVSDASQARHLASSRSRISRDEANAAEADPDLYGLRRSGRATKRSYLPETDDEQDDAQYQDVHLSDEDAPDDDDDADLGIDVDVDDDDDEAVRRPTRRRVTARGRPGRKAAPSKRGGRGGFKATSRSRAISDDEDEVVRFSSRNGKPLPNYNEDFSHLTGYDSDPFEDKVEAQKEKENVGQEEAQPELVVEYVMGMSRDDNKCQYSVLATPPSHKS